MEEEEEEMKEKEDCEEGVRGGGWWRIVDEYMRCRMVDNSYERWRKVGDECGRWRMRLTVKDKYMKWWRKGKHNYERWRRVEALFKPRRKWKMSTRRGGGLER
ncbi:hypothetical protein E2C01_031520 [Portunus trituberculatus]|uniref:Uncharacterized protein n=1 Tax=Portunus trituberculatus TaxID=210409 RepID=A0A5B7ET00_PORTR|nr:hypothetical protein [Portunus trituberculatus]